MFSHENIKAMETLLKIQNIAKRFEKYGAVPLSKYRATRVSPSNTRAWNAYVMQLVYDDSKKDLEEGEYPVFEHVSKTGSADFLDIKVTYNTSGDGEPYLYLVIPGSKKTLSYTIATDGVINPIDMPAITRAMNASLDVNNIDDSDCACELFGETEEYLRIKECRDSGAHNLCNCECGEEHCFVECGPANDETCEMNDNGRCHCKYNRCCGCDAQCEPDDDDE